MIQWHTGAKKVEGLAFSPDGQLLASTSYQAEVVKLWRPDGAAVGKLSLDWRVRAVAFSPDGRRLGVAGNGQSVPLYDPATREPAGRLFTDAPVGTLLFGPDPSLAVAVTGRRLLWWDRPHVAGRSPNGRKPTGRLAGVYQLYLGDSAAAFAPDGRRLVLNNQREAVVLDVPPARVLRRVPHPHADNIRTRVAVSVGGRVAASHGRDIDL